jgi:cytochrome c-type biogenesis protein CcmH
MARSSNWLFAGILLVSPAALAQVEPSPAAVPTPAGAAVPTPAEHGHATAKPANVSQYAVVPGAAELEATLLAPCCWNQTLDNHNSDIATDARREIRVLLLKGQSVDAVRDAMVQKYGARIVAVPDDSPLTTVALGLGVGVGIAGLIAAWALIRWRRQSEASEADEAKERRMSPRSSEPDEFDRRLDEELADEDDD